MYHILFTSLWQGKVFCILHFHTFHSRLQKISLFKTGSRRTFTFHERLWKNFHFLWHCQEKPLTSKILLERTFTFHNRLWKNFYFLWHSHEEFHFPWGALKKLSLSMTGFEITSTFYNIVKKNFYTPWQVF